MTEQKPFMVFSGTATRYLAEKICQSLGCPLGNLLVTKFSDGEFAVYYEESIRGRDVFLVQSTFPNSDNLMELLLMIDAAKRASAKTINAVVPYFGWARQDRKDRPRVSIGAKLVADLLMAAGIDRSRRPPLRLRRHPALPAEPPAERHRHRIARRGWFEARQHLCQVPGLSPRAVQQDPRPRQ